MKLEEAKFSSRVVTACICAWIKQKNTGRKNRGEKWPIGNHTFKGFFEAETVHIRTIQPSKEIIQMEIKVISKKKRLKIEL